MNKLKAKFLALGIFSGLTLNTAYGVQTVLLPNENLNILGVLEGVIFTGNQNLNIGDGDNIGSLLGLSVSSGLATQGNLTFLGSSTIAGSVGEVLLTQYINSINLTGGAPAAVTANGDIYAIATNIDSSTLNLNAHLNGTTLNFTDDGIINLGNSFNIAVTNINNTTSNQGTLNLLGTSIITGDIGSTGVGLKLITVGNADSTINGNILANTINFAGNNTLNIGDGYNLSANVTTSSDLSGILTLQGTTTINGQIGSSSFRLNQLNIAADNKTITLNNPSYAGILNLTGTGTLNVNNNIFANSINISGDATINVAANQNLTAPVTANTNNIGTINFNGSTATSSSIGSDVAKLKAININSGTFLLNHKIAATNININGGTINLATNQALTGDFALNANSNINVNNNTLSLQGDFNQNTNSTLKVTLVDKNNFGKIEASGIANVASNSTVDITVNKFIPHNQSFKVISANSSGTVNIPNTITDNSFTTDFILTTDGTNLTLTANRVNSYYNAVSEDNATSAGRTLETIAANDGLPMELQTVLDSLESSSTVTELKQKVTELTPDTSYNIAQSNSRAARIEQNIISTHLYNLSLQDNLGFPIKSMAAGSQTNNGSMWIKAFTSSFDKKTSVIASGFAAKANGVILGIDKYFLDELLLGFSFGYNSSTVETNNSIKATDTTQYHTSYYLQYLLNSSVCDYISLIFGYGYNDNKSSRYISGLSANAIANFDSSLFTQSFEIGKHFELEGYKLSPFIGLTHTNYEQPQYQETNVGGAGIIYQAYSNANLATDLGITIAKYFYLEKIKTNFLPSIKFEFEHRLNQQSHQALVSYIGAGPVFGISEDNASSNAINTSFNLAMEFYDNLEVMLEYAYSVEDNFSGHIGQLRLSYAF